MLNKLKKSSNQLDTLFYPNSIAVIGASNNIEKIGGYIFSQIKNLTSHIKPIPINPTSLEIQGIKAYQSFDNVEEINQPDLVIIAIPKQFVISELEKISKTKTKNIVIITAGFKETGKEGQVLENQIKELVKKHKFNLIGPNCLGFLNPQINLNCSFAKDIPTPGKTALISQSGAVIDAIIDWSFEKNIGFSKIVSLGNMAGIDELEILKYLKDDKQTDSIVFYMETLEKGEKFAKILNEISKIKPVIIIKPGKSQNAKKAIGSHTGSLAQDNILVETLIKENNGILVENLNELFNILIGLKNLDKLNKANKKYLENTVILTNAGGPGVIATDELSQTKLKLFELNEKQKQILQKYLPNEASINNPIDILGDAKSDRYENSLKELIKIKEINNIIVLLTPQIMTDSENIAKSIIKLSNDSKSNKNIFTAFLGSKQVKHSKTLFNVSSLPTFDTPNDLIQTLSKLIEYKNFNYLPNSNHNKKINLNKIKILNSQIQEKKGLLDQKTTQKILKSLNLNLIEKQFIHSTQDIFNLKLNPNEKYVIKGDSPELIHKKELNAIELNITTLNFKEKIQQMIKSLSKITKNYSITLEKQVSGIETIVGLKSDENLGNFILFGLGGTYVNIFKDINLAQAPISKQKAKQIIENSKANELLKGYRGDKQKNINELIDTIVNISYIQKYYPIIKEVDFNPIICDENDCYLVDVKLII